MSLLKRIKKIFHSRVALIFPITALIYLGIVNFSLPFMVLDEIRSLSQSAADGYRLILLYGRSSTLISHLINQVIGFNSIVYVNLIPRYFAMVTVLIGISTAFNMIGYSWKVSAILASLAIMTHQVDWQHNGLVAFFAGYSLYLGVYLISLFLALRGKENIYSKLTIIFLLVLSYSSELFVLASFGYLCVEAISKNKFPDLKNSFVVSIIIYLLIFVYVRGQSANEHVKHMDSYILGAYSKFSVKEIFLSIMVYTAGIIPHVQMKSRDSIAIALSIFLFVGLLFIYAIKKLNEIEYAKLQLMLFAVIILLLPPILMSLQPLKVEWAIHDMSNRYAFSMYGWFGVLLLIGSAINFSKNQKVLSLNLNIFVIFLIFLVLYSVPRNLDFVKSYKNSFLKWKELNVQANNGQGDLLIDRDLLNHPYIVPYDRKLYSEYIRAVYSRRLLVCDAAGFNLAKANKDFEKIRLSNFYEAESDGRWTAGKASRIKFIGKYPAGSSIFLEISDVYGENGKKPLTFSVGEDIYDHQIRPNSIIQITLTKDISNPLLNINLLSDYSPASLGTSKDLRAIGIKINRVGIFEPNENQLALFTNKNCHD